MGGITYEGQVREGVKCDEGGRGMWDQAGTRLYTATQGNA